MQTIRPNIFEIKNFMLCGQPHRYENNKTTTEEHIRVFYQKANRYLTKLYAM